MFEYERIISLYEYSNTAIRSPDESTCSGTRSSPSDEYSVQVYFILQQTNIRIRPGCVRLTAASIAAEGIFYRSCSGFCPVTRVFFVGGGRGGGGAWAGRLVSKCRGEKTKQNKKMCRQVLLWLLISSTTLRRCLLKIYIYGHAVKLCFGNRIGGHFS